MAVKSYADRLPRVATWEKVTDVPLAVLGVGFLVVYAYPILVPDLSESVRAVLRWVDIGIWIVFAGDYVGRLVIAEQRFHFVRSNLVDLLVVVLPPTRPLRLLRVAALLVETMWRNVKYRTRARMAVFVTGTTLLLILLASLAILDAERGAPDAQITTFGDALWWAVVSVTTVGYGDLTPVTGEGRMVALSMMFIGIGLIGFVTGSVTSWVIDKINEMGKTHGETQSDVNTVLTSVHTLRNDLSAIREELSALREELGSRQEPPAQRRP